MIRAWIKSAALCCTLVLASCSGDEADQPPANPLLYEIANADGEVEGWMLGTIHALPDGVEWRNDAIDEIIEEADLLVVEVRELENRPLISTTFGRLSSTPDMGPLAPRVGEEFRPILAEMLERGQFTAGHFDDMETWAAAITIAQVDAEGSPENGVDRYMIRAFEGRVIKGFEHPALQLGIFDELSPEDQQDLLEGVITEWGAGRENRGRLREAWRTGDVAALEAATSTGIMADLELRQALLIDRNKHWATQLSLGFRYPERPLVAVGAAHLVGPYGLPVMLEARGFTVRRIGQ